MLKRTMLIFIGVMFLLPLNVKAANGTVELNCEKNTISSSESTKCSIIGNFDYQISAFHGVIAVGDKLVLSDIKVDSSWEGDGDKGIIDLYTDKNKTGKVNFVTFVLKPKNTDVSGDISLLVKEMFVGDKNFEEVTLKDATFKLKVTNNSGGNNNDSNNDNNDNDKEDNKNENVTTNPQTGNNSIIYISILLVITLILIVLQKKTKKKKTNLIFWR